jgi:phage shock protein A
MNLIKRITDLLKADLHYLIDQAEDPERMLQQVIREIDSNISKAKIGVVKAIASEKQLLGQLEDNRGQTTAWAERAECALSNGQEGLARKALIRKFDYERIAASLESSWTAAKNTVTQLKAQLQTLKAKRAELLHRQMVLLARQRAANAQCYLNKTLNYFQHDLDIQEKFIRLETRIAEREAEAQAFTEILEEPEPLAQECDNLAMTMRVEEELALLKQKIPHSTAQDEL